MWPCGARAYLDEEIGVYVEFVHVDGDRKFSTPPEFFFKKLPGGVGCKKIITIILASQEKIRSSDRKPSCAKALLMGVCGRRLNVL